MIPWDNNLELPNKDNTPDTCITIVYSMPIMMVYPSPLTMRTKCSIPTKIITLRGLVFPDHVKRITVNIFEYMLRNNLVLFTLYWKFCRSLVVHQVLVSANLLMSHLKLLTNIFVKTNNHLHIVVNLKDVYWKSIQGTQMTWLGRSHSLLMQHIFRFM